MARVCLLFQKNFQKKMSGKGGFVFPKYVFPGFVKSKTNKKRKVERFIVAPFRAYSRAVVSKVLFNQQTHKVKFLEFVECFTHFVDVVETNDTQTMKDFRIEIDLSLPPVAPKRSKGAAHSMLRNSIDRDIRSSVDRLKVSSTVGKKGGQSERGGKKLIIAGATRDPSVLKALQVKEQQQQQQQKPQTLQSIPFSKFVAPPKVEPIVAPTSKEKSKFLDNLQHKRPTVACASVSTNALTEFETSVWNSDKLTLSEIFLSHLDEKSAVVEKLVRDRKLVGDDLIYFGWLKRFVSAHHQWLSNCEKIKHRHSWSFFKEDVDYLLSYVCTLNTLFDECCLNGSAWAKGSILEGPINLMRRHVGKFVEVCNNSSLDPKYSPFESYWLFVSDAHGSGSFFGHIRKRHDEEEDIVEVADKLHQATKILFGLVEKVSLGTTNDQLKVKMGKLLSCSERGLKEMKSIYEKEVVEEVIDYSMFLNTIVTE